MQTGSRLAVRPKRVGNELSKTFCEFFAGIGLVEEGLRPTGWSCIYANDNDTRKQQMHQARNGPMANYHLEDVGKTSEIVARIQGKPFLATASFPCIDLSTAGHYRGFGGQHSSVFFAFADVLQALGKRRPKLVMLENVVGFLSSRKGNDFTAAAITLAGLGYWLDAFVLDANHFVPQSRPRVFVIGLDKSLRSAADRRPLDSVWSPTCGEQNQLRPASVIHFKERVRLATGWVTLNLPAPPIRQTALEAFIDLDDNQDWWDEAEVERHYHMMSDRHRHRVDVLLASGTRYVGTVFRRIRQGAQRAEVRFDGLAGCLRTPKGGSGRQIVIFADAGRLRMRWMSPREYGRLQGVENFPLTLPTRQLLWGFADAVCVPAIGWIDKHILTPLYESSCHGTGAGSGARLRV